MSFEKIGTYTENGTEYTFNYNTNLTMVDKLKFVNTVTGFIVGDNFNFLARNLFFDFEIIDIFTDYNINYVFDLKDSISEMERLLNETDIVATIKENMTDGLLAELYEAVNLNVEYKTGIHKDTVRDAIEEILKTIETKIQEVDMEGFNAFAKVFSKHAKDFTPAEIINAYSNSDIFKKRTRQMEQKRKQQMEDTLNEIKQNQGLKVLNNK